MLLRETKSLIGNKRAIFDSYFGICNSYLGGPPEQKFTFGPPLFVFLTMLIPYCNPKRGE